MAHSLSQICRFLGHTDGFYSVAQHSVLVSEHVPHEDALWGLLHDASEAYLCDLPAPIKRDPEMSIYRIAEDRLMLAVCERYGLPPEMPRVGEARRQGAAGHRVPRRDDAGRPEWIGSRVRCEPLATDHIVSWAPACRGGRFLRRFEELTR